MLELDAVTKRFGGLTAVGEVSFRAAEGEILGIIGPNGAGKTTLFNVISGFYAPDEGRAGIAVHRQQDLERPRDALALREFAEGPRSCTRSRGAFHGEGDCSGASRAG